MRASLASATAILAITAGCSAEPPSRPTPGTLPAGTAQFSINGKDVRSSNSVHCEVNGYLTTLMIADEPYRVTAMVSNAGKLKLEWVRIHDLNGFTGSYSSGLDDNARVAMTGPTYDVTGSAYGSNVDNPDMITNPFEMKIAC